MNKRKEYLEQHKYNIWQGKDGRWYTHLPDITKKDGRKLVRLASRKSVEDSIVAYYKKKEFSPSIREVFDKWAGRRAELNQISKSTYTRYVQDANRYFKEIGDWHIDEVTVADLTEYLEKMVAEYHLTTKAFTNLKTIVKGIFKYARRHELTDVRVEDAIADLDIPNNAFCKNIKEDETEVFNEEEMSKMMEHLVENPDKKNLILLLIFVTGIRAGEAVALKHSDFDGNTFRIRRTSTRYKDNSGDWIHEVKDYPKSEAGVRTCVIPREYSWLTERIRFTNYKSDYIFVGTDGELIKPQQVRHRLYRLCNNLGIVQKSPHKARKTYATILLDNGVDNNLVTKLRGHTNVATTEGHYHRNRKDVDQILKIVSGLPDFRKSCKERIG